MACIHDTRHHRRSFSWGAVTGEWKQANPGVRWRIAGLGVGILGTCNRDDFDRQRVPEKISSIRCLALLIALVLTPWVSFCIHAAALSYDVVLIGR